MTPCKPKSYQFDGYKGLVYRARSQETGRLYSVYNAEQAGLDTYGGPWVTVCEEHHTICNHRTLALAKWHRPTGDWCDQCNQEREDNRHA